MPSRAILQQPVSRIAEQGTHVDFTVLTDDAGFPMTYKWLVNGTDSGVTTKTYSLDNVQLSNAATYQLMVIGPTTNTLSDPAYLGVYALSFTNAANQGTLNIPIGYIPVAPEYTCSGGGKFQRGFSPMYLDYTVNPPVLKVSLFYGPNVPTASQKGYFTNEYHLPKLTIDTFGSTSGNDTGLRLRNTAPPYEDVCNDNASPSTIQSQIYSLPLAPTGAYWPIILLKSIPPPTPMGIVKLNWSYHPWKMYGCSKAETKLRDIRTLARQPLV
jgi:hypothetical protein